MRPDGTATRRNDRHVKPVEVPYRLLSNDECRRLHGRRVPALTDAKQIVEVHVTSVKEWKRKTDIEVHCKYGLYDYFTVALNDHTKNETFIEELYTIATLPRYTAEQLDEMARPKGSYFDKLAVTFDWALPETVLDQLAPHLQEDIPLHLVISTTVWAYPEGSIFGEPVSCCSEVQEVWNVFVRGWGVSPAHKSA